MPPNRTLREKFESAEILVVADVVSTSTKPERDLHRIEVQIVNVLKGDVEAERVIVHHCVGPKCYDPATGQRWVLALERDGKHFEGGEITTMSTRLCPRDETPRDCFEDLPAESWEKVAEWVGRGGGMKELLFPELAETSEPDGEASSGEVSSDAGSE